MPPRPEPRIADSAPADQAPAQEEKGMLLVGTAALDALFAAFEADSAFADHLGLGALSSFGIFG